MKMASILKTKGARVVTAQPHTKVTVVAHRMKLERVGAVVISQDEQAFQGLITERDILSGLVDHGADLLDLPASALMSRETPTCTLGDNVEHVMAVMTQRRVRHVPVIEKGRLVGLVSIGDLVKSRLAEMQTEANVLRDYAIVTR